MRKTQSFISGNSSSRQYFKVLSKKKNSRNAGNCFSKAFLRQIQTNLTELEVKTPRLCCKQNKKYITKINNSSFQ